MDNCRHQSTLCCRISRYSPYVAIKNRTKQCLGTSLYPTQRFSLSSGFIIGRCTLRTDKGGVTRKKLRSHSMISLEYLEEKSHWILISLFCLQDGRRYAKKTEVFISSTENKESTMNDDVLRNTEVDMSPIYSRT